MAQYSQYISFHGGLNTDDGLHAMPNGDYMSLINGRHMPFSAGGNANSDGGQIQFAQGVGEYANTGLASGNNIIIGWCPYIEEQSLILFYFNDLGNHSIWQFNTLTQVYTKLIEDALLGFKIDYKVFHAGVYDHILYWTDGYFGSFINEDYNPPRELDIEKAKAGFYTTVNWQSLDVIKWPAPFSPQCQYTTLPYQEDNKLYGKLFQFRVQYVYYNQKPSVWSPISNTAIPVLNEYLSGRNWIYPDDENAISVTFLSGPYLVKKIRVAVRMGNSGQFSIVKEYDKDLEGIPNDTPIVFDFTNDSITKAIPLALPNYDLVPQVAYCQEILPVKEGAAALAYSAYYEGYDNTEIDMGVERVLHEIEGQNPQLPVVSLYSPGIIPLKTNLDNVVAPCGVMEGDIFSISTTLGTFNYTVSASDMVLIDAEPTSLLKWPVLLTILGDWLASVLGTTGAYDGGTQMYVMDGSFALDIGVTFRYNVQRLVKPISSLKKGATHIFGIQYYDRGLRSDSVNTNDSLVLFVPFDTQEDTSGFTDPNNPYYVTARLTINHVPPPFADRYKIVRRKNIEILDFQRRVIRKIEQDQTTPFRLKISLEDYYEVVYQGANINHVPQPGDVIRFITQPYVAASLDFPNKLDTYVETTVLDYQPSGGQNGSEMVMVATFDWQTLFGGMNADHAMLCEIYTPRKEDDNAEYYELPDDFTSFDIIDPYTPQRRHNGNVQPQIVGVQPAIVDMDYGDVYVRARPQGTGELFPNQTALYWVEDYNCSDYYISNTTSIGRLAIRDSSNARKFMGADVRHSKNFVDNSNMNGMSTFVFTDKVSLNEQYGRAFKIIMSGFTLKVIQARKEVSIYIQQAYAVDGTGGGQLAYTDRVFGGVREMAANYGTIHAGSVVPVKNNVLYYDHYNGIFVESTEGGQINICEGSYKFVAGANSIKNMIDGIEIGGLRVETTAWYNERLNEYQFFYGASDDYAGAFYGSGGVAFRHDRRRWECYLSYPVRVAMSLGSAYYISNKDMMWVDDPFVTSDVLYFFGEKYNFSINFAFNENYTVVKRPIGIHLLTNIVFTEGFIVSDNPYWAGYTSGTIVSSGYWVQMEGGYYMYIRKDIYDPNPNFITSGVRLFSARDVRGKAFNINLVYNPNDPSAQPVPDGRGYLQAANINYVPSPPIP